jgi:pimeloyl-ACP methyl ester carboxylesterase
MAATLDLFNQLQDEFVNILPEKRFEHIKVRLSAINNPDEKKIIEGVFLLLQNGGMLNLYVKPTLVAMIHGIRTQAEWYDDFKDFVESNSSVIVKPVKFGFFNAIAFWLPLITIFRWLKVRHVTENMKLLRRDFPDHKIVIVAHSFGTYITAKFLKNNTDFDVDRIILCGSIVSENFKWDKLPNFPRNSSVINDIGTKDIWPVLAKTSTFGYGASGALGFNTSTIENRYHDVAHSDFFTNELFGKYWLPFILDGEIVKSPNTTKRQTKSYYISILSLFPGISLFLIPLFIIAGVSLYKWLF